jgi:hypothetical protein
MKAITTPPVPPFQVHLAWNREQHYVSHGSPLDDLNDAIKYARSMENSGDGARVKKTRIEDSEGRVVWEHGKKVKLSKNPKK